MKFWNSQRLVALIVALLLVSGSAALAGADEESLRKGRAVARQLLSQRPVADATVKGTISIRPAKGATRDIPFVSEVKVAEDGWKAIYETKPVDGSAALQLAIHHSVNAVATYSVRTADSEGKLGEARELELREVFEPFAGSDFRIIDLAYPHSDHLTWPEQRLLRSALRRGQSCYELESVNPRPGSGGFAKVISWIDIDTGGPLEINGYDGEGERELQFSPKRFRKVDGEFKVTELHVRNRKTGSRTILRFEFEPSRIRESRAAAEEARDAARRAKAQPGGN